MVMWCKAKTTTNWTISLTSPGIVPPPVEHCSSFIWHFVLFLPQYSRHSITVTCTIYCISVLFMHVLKPSKNPCPPCFLGMVRPSDCSMVQPCSSTMVWPHVCTITTQLNSGITREMYMVKPRHSTIVWPWSMSRRRSQTTVESQGCSIPKTTV